MPYRRRVPRSESIARPERDREKPHDDAFRPTLAELTFAFAFPQIVLPRRRRIVLGTKIVPARQDRADDGRGIRTTSDENQLRILPGRSLHRKGGSKSAGSRTRCMTSGRLSHARALEW